MSRVIRGNLYEKNIDGLFHLIVSNANAMPQTRHGMISSFHDIFDKDGRALIGSLVVCRSSALGPSDSTGVVVKSYTCRETKKMGFYGQMLLARNPVTAADVKLLGNYDVIDFQDVESYMNLLPDNRQKRMEFLNSVKQSELLKNSLVEARLLSGSVTNFADTAIRKQERPLPALSISDIDIGRSYDGFE